MIVAFVASLSLQQKCDPAAHGPPCSTLQQPCSSLINKWGFYQPRVFCHFLPADVWQPRRARAASETLFCGATAVCSAARCWFLGVGAASSLIGRQYPYYLTCELINFYTLQSGYFAWSVVLLVVAGAVTPVRVAADVSTERGPRPDTAQPSSRKLADREARRRLNNSATLVPQID